MKDRVTEGISLQKGITRRVIGLMVLCGVLPLLLFGGLFIAFFIREELLDTERVQKEVAERLAAAISGHFEEILGQVKAYAHLISLKGMDPKGLSLLSEDLLIQGHEYEMVTVADPRGEELCKVSRHRTYRPSDLRSLPKGSPYRWALAGTPVLSSVELSEDLPFPHLHVAAPLVLGEGTVMGVLDVAVNITRFWKLIAPARIAEGLLAYVVDNNGRLLAHQEVSDVLQAKNLGALVGVRNFLDRSFSPARYRGYRGEEVIGASALVPRTGWGVIVEEPVRLAYAEVYQVSAVLAVSLLCTLILAFLVGFVFSLKKITLPIQQLRQDASRIADGDWDHRVALQGKNDEIGHLARSFNEMVDALQETAVSRESLLREVSERKAVEAALRESEERLREIIEHSTNLFYRYGTDRVLTYLSPQTRELLDCEPEEALVRWTELTTDHPENLRGMERTQKAIDTGERQEPFELELAGKKGRRVWVEVHESPVLKHGKVVAMVGALSEITLRKAATEALREEKERFRILVEESPLGISLAGEDSRYHYVNPAFTRIFGTSLKDLTEEHRGEGHPPSGPRPWEGGGPEAPKGDTPGIFKTKGKDGVEKVVQYRCVPIQGGDRILLFEDITERVSLEDRLRRAEKLEAIGTLAGGIAHNFNNLLMTVMGNASLLLLGKQEGDADISRLRTIEACVRQGAQLTRQLLGFARGGTFELQRTDLNTVVARSVEIFASTKREVRMEIFPEEGLRPVKADPGQVQQVLLNLFINAGHAMPGGGTLTVATRNLVLHGPQAEKRQLREGPFVEISVSDTGIGMDEEVMPRIFEPFFTTKEVGKGTGLGLASAYGIMQTHGGTIEVRSRKGIGTTFSLLFPALPWEVPGTAQGGSAGFGEEIPQGDRATVLLVDDEEMVREVGKDMLEALGYRVRLAGSGEEAVRLLQEARDRGPGAGAGLPDLVLLDMTMPGLDGERTYEAISGLLPSVRVLLSSGYILDDKVRQLLARGCRGFIQKPFEMGPLAKKLRDILCGGGADLS